MRWSDTAREKVFEDRVVSMPFCPNHKPNKKWPEM